MYLTNARNSVNGAPSSGSAVPDGGTEVAGVAGSGNSSGKRQGLVKGGIPSDVVKRALVLFLNQQEERKKKKEEEKKRKKEEKKRNGK